MIRPATALDRLRLLRDCGVARAKMGDRSFGSLVEKGLAAVSYPPDAPGRVDYRLTGEGRRRASSPNPAV